MPHLRESDQEVSIVIADDDNELVRQTIAHLHQEYGAISVSGFSDSRQAAALVVRARPSLLICSPQLPRVGGMDLITLAQKRWGQLPAIVLVQGAGLGPSGYLRASSTVTYLEKPFSPEVLRRCITALIGLAPQPAEPPRAAEPVDPPAAPESVPTGADGATEPKAEQAAAEPHAEALEDGGEHSVLEVGDAEPTDAESINTESIDTESIDTETIDSETIDYESIGAESIDPEPVLAAPEEASESQPEEEQTHPARLLSAETFPLRAGEEDPYQKDPSLSSVTPLPVSSPPAHEISDIWLQQSISASEPSESSASPLSALVMHNEDVSQKGEWAMALTATSIKENLAKLESIDGFVGAALADSENGMCLGFIGGGGGFNLEVAAAANTEVVRSKRKAMKALNLRDDIEDILISLGKQYHLIRPVRTRPSLFYYLALDRQRANLAMARFTLAEVERDLPM